MKSAKEKEEGIHLVKRRIHPTSTGLLNVIEREWKRKEMEEKRSESIKNQINKERERGVTHLKD